MKFSWFKRWRKQPEPPPQQQQEQPKHPIEANDWVVIPYRIAEACRISVYTIGSHPELPDSLRLWIAQWLVGYNHALAQWFQSNYGPQIFDVLTEITKQVRDMSEQVYADQYAQAVAKDFEQWQKELQEGSDSDD